MTSAEGFVGDMGVEDILKGGRETPAILSSALTSHCSILWHGAHHDAAGQDDLNGASVEHAQDGSWCSGYPQLAEEVEVLLGFTVIGPQEVFWDVHTQEPGVAYIKYLNCAILDGGWETIMK